MDLKIFIIRIVSCFTLSIIIGLERQCRHRMVGLRTNVLVSLGAFLFVCVSFGAISSDQTRIAAQVVSGIGFLGAGVILRDGNKIKGLNTAATLWCVAAIGVLCATGMVTEAAIGTCLVLFSNVFLRLISITIMEKVKKYEKEKCTIRISCEKDIESIIRTDLSKSVQKNYFSLKSLEKNEITKTEVKLKAIITTTRPNMIEEIVKRLSIEPGVTSISWEHEKYIQTDNEDSDSDDNE